MTEEPYAADERLLDWVNGNRTAVAADLVELARNNPAAGLAAACRLAALLGPDDSDTLAVLIDNRRQLHRCWVADVEPRYLAGDPFGAIQLMVNLWNTGELTVATRPDRWTRWSPPINAAIAPGF